MQTMKLRVATLLLGIGWAILGPAAHLADAQALNPYGDVAVSQQFGLNQTDVFTIDYNNKLAVFWVDGGGAWRGGLEVGPPILMGGMSLAASRQFGLNQTDVFTIDENGQLEVYWVGTGAWQGPEKIGPSGLFLPGAPLVASQQFGLNQTDVFAVDKNGQLEVFWVGGGGAWQGPQKIGAPVAEAGSYCFLAAGQQIGLNQTDVFVVDQYGRLDVFSVQGGGAWQGPKQIGATGLAEAQFCQIAVSQQIGLNQTDIFLVDRTGQMNVFWVEGGGAWGGPVKIGAPGLFQSSSFVAASQQFGLNQTDVFAIDSNDQLDVFWVDGGGAWGGPVKIGSAGLPSTPGGEFAVSQQIGLNQTDVFMIDYWDNLDAFWVDGGGAWNGPLVIDAGPGI